MTVTRIEELSRSRCKIYLEDSFAFVLYKGELRLYGVREQEELSEESYREIMQEEAILNCTAKDTGERLFRPVFL